MSNRRFGIWINNIVSIPKGAIMSWPTKQQNAKRLQVSIPKGAIMSSSTSCLTLSLICFNSKRCDYEFCIKFISVINR